VKKLSKQHALSDGLAVYRRLQSDDQDSVRLLTVEDLIAIAQRLTPAEVKEQLLKQIRQTVSDKSWRVRYMAATHFNEVRSGSWLCGPARSLNFFPISWQRPLDRTLFAKS
jgi:serine/threonine-protein phosphatase 2A regulatory subunit A